LSHGTCSYICMYINAVADSVMLYLQHDFYNIIFKIKHKLYTASGYAPPPPRKNSGCAPGIRGRLEPSTVFDLSNPTFTPSLLVSQVRRNVHGTCCNGKRVRSAGELQLCRRTQQSKVLLNCRMRPKVTGCI
jgi:hypothetical protein